MREQTLHRCGELEIRSRIPNRVGAEERFPVLLYHSISYTPRSAPFEYLVIPRETFQAQIRMLSRRVTARFAQETLFAGSERTPRLPQNPC
jgi:hypothetical protein